MVIENIDEGPNVDLISRGQLLRNCQVWVPDISYCISNMIVLQAVTYHYHLYSVQCKLIKKISFSAVVSCIKELMIKTKHSVHSILFISRLTTTNASTYSLETRLSRDTPDTFHSKRRSCQNLTQTRSKSSLFAESKL